MAKQNALIATLFILAFSLSGTAYASGLTFGAKTGPMQLDGANIDDDPTNAGVVVGYELGVVLGDVGFEGELTTTMKDGSTKGTPSDDISVDTMGLYATYRSPGFLYLKAKTGFTRWDLSAGSYEEDDTVTSMGLGIGFSLGIIQFELEYTEIDDDIEFISLGVQF